MNWEKFYKNNKWNLWISSTPIWLVLVLIMTMDYGVNTPDLISIPLFLFFAWISTPFYTMLEFFGMTGAKGFPTSEGFFLIAFIYSFLIYGLAILVEKMKKQYFS